MAWRRTKKPKSMRKIRIDDLNQFADTINDLSSWKTTINDMTGSVGIFKRTKKPNN